MASYFGMNNFGVSSMFSNQNTNNSMYGLYSLFSEYKSIQTGSYHKLLKAYYAKADTSDSKESKSTSNKKTSTTAETNSEWKTAASNISSLKSAAKALTSGEYTEEKRSDVEKNIADFVSAYNSTIKSTSQVISNTLSRRTDWMTRITSNSSKALEKVGITVNSDKTLSLDKTALSEADLSDIKSAFYGNSSYAGQVNSSANLMAQVAARGGSSTTSSLYTSQGSYNTLSSSSMYDYLF